MFGIRKKKDSKEYHTDIVLSLKKFLNITYSTVRTGSRSTGRLTS